MKITIPKPCHENWETMTPEEKGRYCDFCKQTVHDFTKNTDEEIVDFFAQKPQNVCGNFNENQLNRNLEFSFINSVLAKFAVGLTLTAGGFTSLNAQETCSSQNKHPKETQVDTDSVKVKGKITTRVSPIDSLQLAVKRRNQLMKEVLLGKVLIDTPLYILNGKEISETDFKKVNKKDIKSIHILKGEESLKKYADKARFGAVVIETKTNNGLKIDGQRKEKTLALGGVHSVNDNTNKPLYILDGKIVTEKDFNLIDAKTIESVTVLKDQKATVLYGISGKNGVIIIKSKKKKK